MHTGWCNGQQILYRRDTVRRAIGVMNQHAGKIQKLLYGIG
jgi:hypothetical protein